MNINDINGCGILSINISLVESNIPGRIQLETSIKMKDAGIRDKGRLNDKMINTNATELKLYQNCHYLIVVHFIHALIDKHLIYIYISGRKPVVSRN